MIITIDTTDTVEVNRQKYVRLIELKQYEKGHGGRMNKWWTDEEYDQLDKEVKGGMKVREIAAAHGRNEASILAAMKRLKERKEKKK